MIKPRPQPLLEHYHRTRTFSRSIAELLQPEDQVIQSMPDASPIKWHLAHTTWFFETFILLPSQPQYQPFQAEFTYLFNSYYNHVGPQFLRKNRGLISRPTVSEVNDYRHYVDRHIEQWLQQGDADKALLDLLVLGIHHEQQHQELMITDIKHAFSFNPLHPQLTAFQPREQAAPELRWLNFPGGEVNIGHPDPQKDSFHFDNEGPTHKVLLQPYQLAQRLVTNREFQSFIEDGGYRNPLLWLSDGWAWLQSQQIEHPLYWQQQDGRWQQYTLAGLRELDPDEPACHLSYYEADAFAQWFGKRLPTEFEWEAAAQHSAITGGSDLTCLHPQPASAEATDLLQLYGACWQWTQSAYSSYPGFRPAAGAVGEYNGKFMCNQLVLKGSSCATPKGHARASYRNFFPAHAQWQFTGIRMADNV